MKKLAKFFRLSSVDQYLLIKSTLLVWVIRLGLWFLPFQVLRRFLAKVAGATAKPRKREQIVVDKIAWAVKAASRTVPAATCLTQALATQTLLIRYGQSACLRIGVLRTEAGQLEAHAWVESQGKIVIGGLKNLTQFTPLPPVESGGR